MTDKPEKHPEFKPGSWEVLRYVRDHCNWPSGAKMVYKALYERWGNGPLFPSDSTLAQDLGVTVRFVIKWRKWLADNGLLAWHSGKEIGDSNQYTLFAPWRPATSEETASYDSGRGMNDVHRGYELGSHLGMNEVHTSRPGYEPDSHQVRTTFTPGMNDVHTKYPNEVPTEDKGTGTTAAIKKTDVLGKNLSSEEELRGGCGGRNWPGIPKEWVTVVPPIPEWNGVLECKRALNQVLIILGDAELTRDEPFAQQDEAGRPYALVLQKFKDAAAARGRPLQWWIQHAGIAAIVRETEFNPQSLEEDLARLARGEVLNPGVPEWASLNDYLGARDYNDFWDDAIDPMELARLGATLPADTASSYDHMRWTAVNKVALAKEGEVKPPAHAARVRDLLLQAEESGARLEDDPGAMRFRLVGGRADVRAGLLEHGELVQQILAEAYRMPERPNYHAYVIWLHSRFWRVALVRALERNQLQLVGELVADRPEFAAQLSERRGWVKRYPAAAPILRTLERTYA